MNFAETVKFLTDNAFKEMTKQLEQELFYGHYFDYAYDHINCCFFLSHVKYNKKITIIEYR